MFLDSNIPYLSDLTLLAVIYVRPVIGRRIQDKFVEAGLRLPAQFERSSKDRNLLEGLGLHIHRSVDVFSVDMNYLGVTMQEDLDPLRKLLDGRTVCWITDIEYVCFALQRIIPKMR